MCAAQIPKITPYGIRWTPKVMKIRVKDIKPAGLEVVEAIPLEIFELSGQDGVCFLGPLTATANANRVDNSVLVKVHMHGRHKSPCCRCLEMVEEDWDRDFVLDYPVGCDTESIELEDDIRQEVILNLPQRILCRTDCQGICPLCGAELNKETCQCKL